MHEILNTTDRKKIALITAVLLIFSGALMVIAFMGISSSANSSVPNTPDKEITQRDQIPEESAPSFSAKPGMEMYITDFFEVSYPNSWRAVQNEYVGNQNGELIVFTPESSPVGAYDPLFSISYDYNTQDFRQRIDLEKEQGFEESTVSIGGRQFTRIAGSYPEKEVNKQVVKSPVWETHLFAVKDDVAIVIRYVYSGSAKNSEQEAFFNTFLQSIEFY